MTVSVSFIIRVNIFCSSVLSRSLSIWFFFLHFVLKQTLFAVCWNRTYFKWTHGEKNGGRNVEKDLVWCVKWLNILLLNTIAMTLAFLFEIIKTNKLDLKFSFHFVGSFACHLNCVIHCWF